MSLLTTPAAHIVIKDEKYKLLLHKTDDYAKGGEGGGDLYPILKNQIAHNQTGIKKLDFCKFSNILDMARIKSQAM